MTNNNINSKERLPGSFWYFLIVLSVIVGTIVYNCTKPKEYPKEEKIEQKIDSTKTERKGIIESVKSKSEKAARKGDSLILILKTEPYRLEEKDLEDSIVRAYLRNYHYQQ